MSTPEERAAWAAAARLLNEVYRVCDCHQLRICPTAWMLDRDADDWDRGKERARTEQEEREAHQ